MKLSNYITKNIDLWLNYDTDILDLFFLPQNATTDALTRYLDFEKLYFQHIRPNYWQYNTKTNLPLLTFWVEDYSDGTHGGCKRNVNLVFRLTVRSQVHDVPIDPELVDIIDPLDFADNVFSNIKCKLEADPNIFKLNECKMVEKVDCGVTTIAPFSYNVRGRVNGAIINRELPANDKEVIQYELIIPLSIKRIFKNCPCPEIEEDC